MEYSCDPAKGCLRALVWNGEGVNAAATKVFNLDGSQTVEASVAGECVLQKA